jgi:hypothetical protein
MKDTDKVSYRLALLQGMSFSQEDLEAIIKDIEDNERVIAELEVFGQSTPWISLQAQPAGKKA